jgi:probable F420-dependent oxidoreductase
VAVAACSSEQPQRGCGNVGVMSIDAARRPFRFSLQAAQAGSRREWVELVKRAEGSGFDMIVTGDHLEGCLAPLIPLATAAEVSDRLRLGIMVLNNDFHHPSLLARDVATLDLLSDGRMEVGIGAGHSKPEYDRAGIAFETPRTRVARLEEAVVALRRLLAGEAVTVEGEHYRLTDERCEPPPVQAQIPVLVGGAGRRVHRIAARHADAVGFTGLGRVHDDGQRADPMRFAVALVDEDVDAARAAAGHRLAHLEFQVLVQAVAVTDDALGVAERILRSHLPSLKPEQIVDTPYMMVGSRNALVEKLLEHRERWGFSHYTVRREALGRFEPVIAELAGR